MPSLVTVPFVRVHRIFGAGWPATMQRISKRFLTKAVAVRFRRRILVNSGLEKKVKTEKKLNIVGREYLDGKRSRKGCIQQGGRGRS